MAINTRKCTCRNIAAFLYYSVFCAKPRVLWIFKQTSLQVLLLLLLQLQLQVQVQVQRYVSLTYFTSIWMPKRSALLVDCLAGGWWWLTWLFSDGVAVFDEGWLWCRWSRVVSSVAVTSSPSATEIVEELLVTDMLAF